MDVYLAEKEGCSTWAVYARDKQHADEMFADTHFKQRSLNEPPGTHSLSPGYATREFDKSKDGKIIYLEEGDTRIYFKKNKKIHSVSHEKVELTPKYRASWNSF